MYRSLTHKAREKGLKRRGGKREQQGPSEKIDRYLRRRCVSFQFDTCTTTRAPPCSLLFEEGFVFPLNNGENVGLSGR